jgi:PAS domain S-box-containing protein
MDLRYALAAQDAVPDAMPATGLARALATHGVPAPLLAAVQALEEERAAAESRGDMLQRAVDTVPGLIWSADVDGAVNFLNERWLSHTGMPRSAIQGHGWISAGLIHPDDVDALAAAWRALVASGVPGEAEARLRARDGSYRWFQFRVTPQRDAAGALVGWWGINTDIEDQKCSEELLAGEKRLLEMIARAEPLCDIMDACCRLFDQVGKGAISCLLLLDDSGTLLRPGSAPNLPAGFMLALEGSVPVGPGEGSCGTAAWLREPVFVADIATDPLWDKYRTLPLAHGFKACWSMPIMSSAGKVLGTFGVYSRHAAPPSELQHNVIVRFSHLASIVIERTMSIAALRRSEERYELAVDAAGDGHTDWVVASDSFYASPRFLAMCGMPADTVFASRADFHARMPFHPEDRQRVIDELAENFVGSTVRLQLEFRIIVRGEVRWLKLTGLCARDAHGQLLRWIAATTDITDRRRAEIALRASEQRYALAMGAAGEGHWDWNILTDEFYGSPRMLELYGFPPDTVFKGRADFLARFPFHPDDKPIWERAAAEHFAGRSARFDIEIRMLRQGETRWIHLTGLCLRDDSGKPVRWTGAVTDVTERRKLEDQLRLAQRLEAMGTLAGGIAHDFNNILAAILGYGEMALHEAPERSRLRRDLERIVSAGERGRALVDRILAFSRSGMGERGAVHVESVAREALEQLAAKLPGNVRVEAQLRAGRAAMLGDTAQVHQVLSNLMLNGVQAMPGGGVLHVHLEVCSYPAARTATIGTIAAAEYIVLTVRDSGTGIPPAILGRIFDPFFSTKDADAGTGLGLSLVHAIVAELDGAISVASTPGEGSEFVVYLRRSGDAPLGGVAAAPVVPRGHGQRVLVVDNEEALVLLTGSMLGDLGYAHTAHTSPLQALAAFAEAPDAFHAVITDERMPGMSGSELIKALRVIRPGLPIVLASGFPGSAKAQLDGNIAALRKPYSFAELAQALGRVLMEDVN